VITLALDKYRKSADPVVSGIAKPFMGFNPNTLTWMGLLAAVAAAFFLVLGNWYLLLASVLILMSSGFDAVDGKVAKATGRASKRGDFLDHVLDRYGDVFILGAIALGPYCRPTIGLLGVVSVLLVSYLGVQAHALTRKRSYSGIMGRAERMVILIIAPIVQYAAIVYAFEIWQFTVFEVVMIVFAVAGQITAIQRGILTWRDLKGQ